MPTEDENPSRAQGGADPGQHPALGLLVVVGERQVAAEDQIERAVRYGPAQISALEVDRGAEGGSQMELIAAPGEGATPPSVRHFAQ